MTRQQFRERVRNIQASATWMLDFLDRTGDDPAVPDAELGLEPERSETVVDGLRRAGYDEEANALIERLRGHVSEAEEHAGLLRADLMRLTDRVGALEPRVWNMERPDEAPPGPRSPAPEYLTPKKTTGQAELGAYPDGPIPEQVSVYKDGEATLVDQFDESADDIRKELNRTPTTAEEVFDGLS